MPSTIARNLIVGIGAVAFCANLHAQDIARYPLRRNEPVARRLTIETPGPHQARETTASDTPDFRRLPALKPHPTGHRSGSLSPISKKDVTISRPQSHIAARRTPVNSTEGNYVNQRIDNLNKLSTSHGLSENQFRAVPQSNNQLLGQELLSSFQNRASFYREVEQIPHKHGVELKPIPQEFRAWWEEAIGSPIGLVPNRVNVSINSLVESALLHSPNIQVAAAEPHIEETFVFEEAAEFDWTSFLETRYDDQNDPIGNSLTTGTADDRFIQQEWFGRSGLRRRNRSGGEVEFSQRLGVLDNNSSFLVPPNQGNSRLELNYRHPLANRRGRQLNESLILLAKIDFRSASDTFLEQVQQQLVDITEAYWELVRARSEYSQRNVLLNQAEIILANLIGRAEVDVLERQILRAKAAVANRRSEIARSLTSIRNAESRLRLLVNDPHLINATGWEFVPDDLPNTEAIAIKMSDAISTALANRRDISRAIRELRAANVRLGIAKNDILPRLDFLIGAYVAGLEGDNDVFDAWVQQFSDGRPGFNVGLEFEVPLGNRAAHARQRRQQWELRRALSQFRVVVETALAEVELSTREVTTTHQELLGRYHSMVAADRETRFLVDRWRTLPGADDSVILLLEDVLDSQERLADEEAAFAQAQTNYAIAVVRLKQAMGTLFQVNQQR